MPRKLLLIPGSGPAVQTFIEMITRRTQCLVHADYGTGSRSQISQWEERDINSHSLIITGDWLRDNMITMFSTVHRDSDRVERTVVVLVGNEAVLDRVWRCPVILIRLETAQGTS